MKSFHAPPYRWGKRLCAAALCAAMGLTITSCKDTGTVIGNPSAPPSASPIPAPSASTIIVIAEPTPTQTVSIETILPRSEDAGRSYVDDTLFLGDSNTVRYTMYADDTGTAFTTLTNNIGVVSMGAQSIPTLKCAKFKGDSELYTMPDAVAKLKPRRIVIGFGTNNLYGSSTDASNYIASYRKGLAAIAAAWPYADIIVNAIPPLAQTRSNSNLTMTQVDAYNEALVTLCEEEGYHFLNSAEVLKDSETGWAKEGYTLSDGVHLSKNAVTALFSYFRTHALLTEDRRPQPLGTIPEPDGTPAGLISSDPIAAPGSTVKVPVEFVCDGNGSLQGSISQLVSKGGKCSSVTAVASSGWKFSHWTSSIGSVGSSTTLTFTVPSNADAGGVVITAHFEPEEHEHDYQETERAEPSCLISGMVRYTCTICGAITEKDLPALGHDWDEGTITLAPQPGIAGVTTYFCRRCELQHTEPIPPLPTPSPTASPTAAPTMAPTETPLPTEQPTPEVTPEPTPHEHTWVADPSGHVEPTCEQSGKTTYTCSTCGETYIEEIPALGHNWGPGVVTSEPAPGIEGVCTYTCNRCGLQRTEIIPALPTPAPTEAPTEVPTEMPPEAPSPDVPIP